ncbi:MAG: hypothetical protein K6G58_03560 [Lachnospiraceae bacterium]|nr:hypothetical protein [Lachnospiraceae bacterium]
MTNNNLSIHNHRPGSGYPMGACRCKDGVQFTVSLPFRNTLELFIYDGRMEESDHVSMKDYEISSGIYSCIVEGDISPDMSYCYEADGIRTADPFMRNSCAERKFGDTEKPFDNAKLYDDSFDWEDDKLPHIPYNLTIAYQLHVRGFTAHSSSKAGSARGKFSGVTSRIPYLSDLGINQIVLMPCYEFDETGLSEKNVLPDYRADLSAKPKINFWGFTNGCYFMPKAAYSDGDPVNEFKQMVKMCHHAGIEVVMRFYFPDNYNRAYIGEVLRFWARCYHVDGFFLMGSDIPIDMAAADIYLRDRKIYNSFFDKDLITGRRYGFNRNMAFVNSDFMNTCRRFLKSDENQISDFLYRQRLNPSDVHTVNYITDYSGFTLNDLVSYDYKHNEANMEENNDGENFNHSWNCGAEGSSGKKSVTSLRMKQIKNALVFLLLAQGTPMLLAGDEVLNTQGGNNNPYCQDNETGWVVWKQNRRTGEIYEFIKMLIKLRCTHPILHPEREFRLMDYASCGFPDLSYHSDMAWNPRFDNHLRHIGIMICGKYARLYRSREDDFFYIAYNMHWENHTFALPKLPKGLEWSICFITCDENAGAIVEKTLGEKMGSVTVPDRTTVVLTSTPCRVCTEDADKDCAGPVIKEKRTDK